MLLLAVLVVLIVSRDAQLGQVVCTHTPQPSCMGPHL
jgi:hypothetical protein